MSYLFCSPESYELAAQEEMAILRAFPCLAASAAGVIDKLKEQGLTDLDELLDGSNGRTGQRRPYGKRDKITADHPIAEGLTRFVESRLKEIPEADPDKAASLIELGCLQAGKIVTFQGVPVPASYGQLKAYVAWRWKQLNHPKTDPLKGIHPVKAA